MPIVRPPDIVVGGLFYSIFYLLSSATLRARWTELNHNSHMLGSDYDLKMYVRNLRYTLSLQIGAQKPLFRRLRNLTATSTAYIFGIKHDLENRVITWQLQGVSYIVSKCYKFWLKIGPPFYPPYVNSAFYFIARLRGRRSENGTQPNFGKRWTINRANNQP